MIVVDYLDNRFKKYFHNLAVIALYLNAWLCKRLRHLHAANCSANAIAITGYDLDVVLAVKRMERGQSFGNFQIGLPSFRREEQRQRKPAPILSRKFTDSLEVYALGVP